MVTTVTTVTVSTITATAMGASLSLVVIVVLLSLLIQKEVATAASDPRAKALSRALNLAIVPLLMVFGFTVIVRVGELLRQWY